MKHLFILMLSALSLINPPMQQECVVGVLDVSGVDTGGVAKEISVQEARQKSVPVVIPDKAFKAYCLSVIDVSRTGGRIMSDQMAALERISVSDRGIMSLQGIEYCTGLKTLICMNNNIEELDLQYNEALEMLICSGNRLSELDVSANTALHYMDCGKNALEVLDVQHNEHLTLLICADNELEELDVSDNSALEYLDCSNNWLTNLDVTQNRNLVILNCGGNELTELDVTRNEKLLMLCCANNKLMELDVSGNTSLQNLNCQGNKLLWLDISENKDLLQLQCGSNLLRGLRLNTIGLHQSQFLDCANNPYLKELWLKVAQDTTFHKKDAHTTYRWKE
ncbi:MAG: hypothetical protein WBK97_08115 [Bacteroidales bacterium]